MAAGRWHAHPHPGDRCPGWGGVQWTLNQTQSGGCKRARSWKSTARSGSGAPRLSRLMRPNQCPHVRGDRAGPQMTGHSHPTGLPALQPSIGNRDTHSQPSLCRSGHQLQVTPEARPHSPPRGPGNNTWNLAAPVPEYQSESASLSQHLQITAILKQANK